MKLNKDTLPFSFWMLCSLSIYLALFYYLEKIAALPIEQWESKAFGVAVLVIAYEMLIYFFQFRQRNVLVLLFIILTIAFHLSHLMLSAINYPFGSTLTNLAKIRIGEEPAKKAMQVSLRFQFANFVGFYVYDFFAKKREQKPESEHYAIRTIESNVFSSVALIFATGFAAWLLYYIRSFINTFTYGYFEVSHSTFESYLFFISRILLVALIIMMMKAGEKNKERLILCFGCVLYFLGMFSGERAYNLVSLGILAYIFLTGQDKRRIKLRHIVLLLISGIGMTVVLNIIRLTRENAWSFESLINSFTSASNSPVLSLLNEFGITENIVARVCAEASSNHGLQFLTSFLIIIPGISYIVPIDFDSLTLAGKLNSWNLGGSFIADCYFDFGEWGCIFSLLYGVLLGAVFYFYSRSLKNKKIGSVALLSPVLVEFLFSVRSTTYKIPRTVTHYFLIIVAIIVVNALIQRGKRNGAFVNVINAIKNNRLLYSIYYMFFYYIPRYIHFGILFVTRRYNKKYNFNAIQQYKGLHEGKRCFVVATAPSLCVEDLERIKDEYAFGVNSLVNIFDKTEWRPTYYGVQDSGVERVKDKIQQYRDQIKELFVGISPVKEMVPHLGCAEVNYLLNILDHDRRGTKHILKTTDKADHYLYDGFSITFSMIELAMYMGFKEIVLLGVDCDYNGERIHFDDYTAERVPDAGVNMYQAFCQMRQYAEKKGIRIINASRGFKLKAFECARLEDLLEEGE